MTDPRVSERLPDRLTDGDDLVLRRMEAEEAPVLARAVAESLEHLRPWMEWIASEPLALTARRQLMGRWRREWERGGDVMLAIFVDGTLAGSSGLHRRVGPAGLEIGYWLHPAFTGRGIATRAARLLTEAALAQPGVTHVEIHTDRANVRSAAVARRAGYTLVAETPRARRAPAESGIDLVWRIEASPAA